jgi:dephospho-CoA kinase
LLALAVVGPIASGKSLVLETLKELGAATCSADEIARQATETDGATQRRIYAEFGREYRRQDGSLDRKRLADLIFHDDAARERLESILHPLILNRIGSWLHELRATADPPCVAAVEVLRLPKSLRARELFDVVWLCRAPAAARLERLMARDGLTRAEALARLRVQATQGIAECDPDLALDARGTKAELRAQVIRAWEGLPKVSAGRRGQGQG